MSSFAPARSAKALRFSFLGALFLILNLGFTTNVNGNGYSFDAFSDLLGHLFLLWSAGLFIFAISKKSKFGHKAAVLLYAALNILSLGFYVVPLLQPSFTLTEPLLLMPLIVLSLCFIGYYTAKDFAPAKERSWLIITYINGVWLLIVAIFSNETIVGFLFKNTIHAITLQDIFNLDRLLAFSGFLAFLFFLLFLCGVVEILFSIYLAVVISRTRSEITKKYGSPKPHATLTTFFWIAVLIGVVGVDLWLHQWNFKQHQIENCKNTAGGDQDWCWIGVANQTKNTSYCDFVKDRKDNCYATVGQNGRDPLVCEKIVDPYMKGNCLSSVASNSGNKDICDLIKEPRSLQMCKGNFAN